MVFDITADDESSRATFEGEEGVLAGLNPNKVFIELATLSEERVREQESECNSLEIPYGNCPFTGGVAGAESGKLTIFFAGSADVLKAVRPYLSVISQEIIDFGPDVSSATYFKLTFNAKRAGDGVRFIKIMAEAHNAGRDLGTFGSNFAKLDGGMTARVWQDAQKQVAGFTIEMALKDSLYARKLTGGTDPELEETIREFEWQVETGFGQRDWVTILGNRGFSR